MWEFAWGGAVLILFIVVFFAGFRKSADAFKMTRDRSAMLMGFRKPDMETQRKIVTRNRILVHVLQGVLILVVFGAVVYFVPPLRAVSYSLLAGAGIAAVILGFAVQKTFANLFAGIFIGIYEPFRIGDFVAVGEKSGIVEDITLHHTIIRDWRNWRYIFPNALIFEETIENHTLADSRTFKTFEIQISFSADIDKVRQIILDEIHHHPSLIVPEDIVDGRTERRLPMVRVTDWKESGIEIRAGFWVADPFTGYTMKSELLESIKKRFDKAGIEIPYPHRNVIIRHERKRPKSSNSKR